MTTTEAALRDQIEKLLVDDPACNGRVTTWTLDKIAALATPSAQSGDAEVRKEAFQAGWQSALALATPSGRAQGEVE